MDLHEEHRATNRLGELTWRQTLSQVVTVNIAGATPIINDRRFAFLTSGERQKSFSPAIRKKNINMKYVISFFIFTFSLALVGCSSKEVEGQVFIDSPNGPTKLAQVEIQIISETELINHFMGLMPKMNDRYISLFYLVKAAEKNRDHFDNKYNRQINESNEIKLKYLMGTDELSKELVILSNKVISSAQNGLKMNLEIVKEANANITGLKTGSDSEFFYSSNIKGKTEKIFSDVDGKFKINLNSRKKIVIVANKGKMYWFVFIDPNIGDGKVLLTEKNMNGTSCPQCIFNPEQLKTSLAFIPQKFASIKLK